MKRLFVVIMVMCSSQVLAEAKIDATSQETFTQSLEAMKQELPPDKVAALNGAIAIMPLAGFESIKDMLKVMPANGRLELDIKKLDGLTADQIIALSRKTMKFKIVTGPPPGLPKQFKEPLPRAENPGAVASLAGSRWEVSSNTNGNMSVERVTLQADGKVNNGSGTNGRWEQSGSSVRISYNDNYAVYLGTLDDENSMKGAAANVNGTDWTWAAVRSPADGVR